MGDTHIDAYVKEVRTAPGAGANLTLPAHRCLLLTTREWSDEIVEPLLGGAR
jgi:hypothetical protein